ncbi:MAG TPA: SurA N-terminal domain-containing protein [Vicinamibacteria bacterium]|jgi:peptidyl-prolyl cis-trans isomerase D
MLKYFRDRKTFGYLVGSFLLFLVIIAFIILYIPDFLGPTAGGGGLEEEVARVEDISISAQEFLDRYRTQEQLYRSQLGAQYSPTLMRQMGLEDMILRGLIQDALLLVEARRQGLVVTDDELAETIVTYPTFQSEGKFIGQQAYLQLLAQSGMTAAQFESQLRNQILRQKLQTRITDGVLVTPDEVERQYRERNEMAHLEYVFVAKDEVEADAEVAPEVSDDELAGFFEKNQEQYRLPLQRRIRYVSLTPDPFQPAVTVTDREIERSYNENLASYEIPGQVRASHILLKTTEDDEEQVRARAEEVLAQVDAGGDFAALARQYSEDTTAEQGGDLGFFGPGDMVPEFERAAFSLQVGATSGSVRSPYGFHIIKVTERQDPIVRPLDAVREEIRQTLVREKAVGLMEQEVDEAGQYLHSTENLEGYAQQHALIDTHETTFFGRQDPVPELGGSQEFRDLVFELPIGDVSPALRQGQGYVFFEVIEERQPHLPALEEIKETVKLDFLQNKAMVLARARADEVARQLQEASDASGAARAAGLELKTADSFYRGTQLPEAGRSPAVQRAAFEEGVNQFSAPLASPNGYVVLRVKERTGFDPEEFASQRDTFTEQVLAQKRQQFWAAYLQSLQERSSVQINRDALRRVLG